MPTHSLTRTLSPIFYHPDYDRRLRNHTGSCIRRQCRHPLAGSSETVGFRITAGGDFHPAPKIYLAAHAAAKR